MYRALYYGKIETDFLYTNDAYKTASAVVKSCCAWLRFYKAFLLVKYNNTDDYTEALCKSYMRVSMPLVGMETLS